MKKRKNITEIKGILNFLGKSKNFFEEYEILNDSKIYYNKKESNPKFGMICTFKNNPNKFLDIKLSARSYLNLKYFLDKHTRYLFSCQKLFSSILNFTDTNIVAALVPFYDNGHYSSFLILEKENRYLCVNCMISDIICISQSNNFPIYFHQEIVYGLSENVK